MLFVLWSRLSRLLAALLGTWVPPPWLRAVGRGLRRVFAPFARLVQRRPKSALVALLLLAVALVAADRGYRAYQRRPKPSLVQIEPSALAPMPLEDNAKPVPLSLRFLKEGEPASAAKLSLANKVVTSGITVEPAIAGTWKWAGDSELELEPKEDWPVGVTLRIRLSPELFGPQVKLATREVEVKTPAFEARIQSFEFYQDLRDPKVKRLVATVAFSHPVNTAEVARHLTLAYASGERGLFASHQEVKFALHYDKWKGRAFLESDPVPIPDETQAMTLALSAGLHAQAGGPGTESPSSSRTDLPGRGSFLKITGVSPSVADDEKGEEQQILTVTTSAEVSEKVLPPAVSAVLLPAVREKDADHDREENPSWTADDVSDAIANSSPKVALTALPAEAELAKTFHFRYQAPPGRVLLVRVKSGIESFGGYPLSKPYAETVSVPEFTPVVHIQGSGAVLSLAGERKVSLVARQLDAIHVDLMRVLPGQVNHLVSQTAGSFEAPEFANYRFSPDNLAERFGEVLPLVQAGPGRNQYASFDFSRFVKPEGHGEASARRGLFFLTASGWDPVKETEVGPRDQRFILVTDLGLLAKKNVDGTREVYVQRLSKGEPATGVKVQVLGLNGIAVVEATTDNDGHAHFASLDQLKQEKAPVVFLATSGDDLSFLPFDRQDRLLNYSRFDVGGVADDARPGRAAGLPLLRARPVPPRRPGARGGDRQAEGLGALARGHPAGVGGPEPARDPAAEAHQAIGGRVRGADLRHRRDLADRDLHREPLHHPPGCARRGSGRPGGRGQRAGRGVPPRPPAHLEPLLRLPPRRVGEA